MLLPYAEPGRLRKYIGLRVMARFLCDENIFPSTLKLLRSRGFDAKDVKELGLSGMTDRKLFDLAKDEDRILLTLDLHFSNISLFPPSECPGIVIIRVKPAVPSRVDKALEIFLQRMNLDRVKGALVIVSEDRFRIRR